MTPAEIIGMVQFCLHVGISLLSGLDRQAG